MYCLVFSPAFGLLGNAAQSLLHPSLEYSMGLSPFFRVRSSSHSCLRTKADLPIGIQTSRPLPLDLALQVHAISRLELSAFGVTSSLGFIHYHKVSCRWSLLEHI